MLVPTRMLIQFVLLFSVLSKCHARISLSKPPQQLKNSRQVSTPAKAGKWSGVITFPIIPVAAYVVPAEPSASRLLVFSSWGARAFSGPTVSYQAAQARCQN